MNDTRAHLCVLCWLISSLLCANYAFAQSAKEEAPLLEESPSIVLEDTHTQRIENLEKEHDNTNEKNSNIIEINKENADLLIENEISEDLENSDHSAKLSKEEWEELSGAIAEDEKSTTPSLAQSFVSAFQSMNPDMAFILDLAAAYFSKSKNYQTGGHDPTQTGFNFQQLELSVNASVDPFFRFDANLVFSLYGVEIEEAYATTLALPWSLQLRAGQFLSRFGRINSTHPHSWSFVDQVFAVGKFFGSEGNRGLGVEVSWISPLPWYLEIVASMQMATGGATNRSYFGNDKASITGIGDFLYTLAVKQFVSIGDKVGLNFGLNAQFGPNASGNNNRTDVYGADLYLKVMLSPDNESFLAFQAEEFLRLRQIPQRLLIDHAGYAQLLYQINRSWQTALRGEWGSGLKDDPLDPDWTKYRARFSLQATYAPSHFARLRTQLNVDAPRWEKSPIIAAFLNLEVLVGSHPAHNY